MAFGACFLEQAKELVIETFVKTFRTITGNSNAVSLGAGGRRSISLKEGEGDAAILEILSQSEAPNAAANN
jgi:hypothetical protein